MIDCNVSKNFISEHKRMCEMYAPNCLGCPISQQIRDLVSGTDKDKIYISTCQEYCSLQPETYIRLLQEWSDKHPQPTRLSDFLSKYPQALLDESGIPGFCPTHLGYQIKPCSKNCVECWNTLLNKEKEPEEENS